MHHRRSRQEISRRDEIRAKNTGLVVGDGKRAKGRVRDQKKVLFSDPSIATADEKGKVTAKKQSDHDWRDSLQRRDGGQGEEENRMLQDKQ
jgi:hypothetical protein